MSQYDIKTAFLFSLSFFSCFFFHFSLLLNESVSQQQKIINLNQFCSQIFSDCALTCSPHFLSFSATEPQWLQCHGSKAKTIKVYKYVNTAAAAHKEERRNDIFCPRLANPQDTSKLETLMTTNNTQMVKLWGHAGPSDAAPAPCGQSLDAST